VKAKQPMDHSSIQSQSQASGTISLSFLKTTVTYWPSQAHRRRPIRVLSSSASNSQN